MNMNQKMQRLLKIRERMRLYNRQEKMLARDLSISNRNLHAKKIFQAGKIFEEAGILESYDAEKVLSILKKMKDELSQGG